jgi:copper chaperone
MGVLFCTRKDTTAYLCLMGIITESFLIKGMSCGHCEKAVQLAVLELTGVQEAQASQVNGTLIVKFDDNLLGIDQLMNTVNETGMYSASMLVK